MSLMEARGKGQERGSALLIVFVFAAIVAIMLYMELPVVAFEAKREKEQILVDRGQEYAHAVKLFVRKFGMYPATMEQLENTNRMRFLRHRFKDPFTGKDDWRLLHAGPGGTLIDSKVKPAGGLSGLSNGAPGTAGFGSTQTASSGFGSTQTASSGFGSTQTASSGFGSSSTDSGLGTFGASSPASSSADTVVPATPQRPPAVSSNGGPSVASGTGETGGSLAQNDQSPTASLLPSGEADQAAGTAVNGTGQPSSAPNGQTAQNGAPGAPGATGGQNANDTLRQALNTPGTGNPALGQRLGSSGRPGAPLGQTSGGGIAGVASKAKGTTIKAVNDQTDYSLWEFFYDPTKDATRNMPGIGQPGAQPGTQPNANTAGTNAGFGTQSGFGSNSSSFNQPVVQSTNPGPASPSNFGATQPPPQ